MTRSRRARESRPRSTMKATENEVSHASGPVVRVGDDFEEAFPGASWLATECYANLSRVTDLLMDQHNRETRVEHGLSASGRELLVVLEGAREPLEPTVIAAQLLTTSGSMTSLLDTLEKRGLLQRTPHPDDRRKLLVRITPTAEAMLDELLPSLHARERTVMDGALTAGEQRRLIELLAKVAQSAMRVQQTADARATKVNT
jgi:DNA-binding MarR family transcriptional regulator